VSYISKALLLIKTKTFNKLIQHINKANCAQLDRSDMMRQLINYNIALYIAFKYWI